MRQRRWALALLGSVSYGAFLLGDWETVFAVDAQLKDAGVPLEHRLGPAGSVVVINAFRGDTDEAERGVKVLDEAAARITRTIDVAGTLLQRGYVALALERHEEAFERSTRAVRMSPSLAYPGCVVAAFAGARLADAQRLAPILAALEAAPVHGRAIEATRVLLGAVIAQLDSRMDDAVAGYAAAAEAWRDLGLVLELALTDLALVALMPPDDARRQMAAAEARAILERLRAARLLADLDRPVA